LFPRLSGSACLLALLFAAGDLRAFTAQDQGANGSGAAADFWQRFGVDPGRESGVSLSAFSAPQLAPTLTPIIGLNYENAQVASQVRGAWLEALRVGPVAIGSVVSVDRQLALSRVGDEARATRFGGFLAYHEAGREVGRLSIQTGQAGGFDVRATRSFKLTDRVSLDIGPTVSLGSFERFGYRPQFSSMAGLTSSGQPFNTDRAQLGAFGLTTSIETRISDRTVARMFADYARIDAQRGQPAIPGLQNRDRVDFGFSLSTRIGD
jgi:hypothetical protein